MEQHKTPVRNVRIAKVPNTNSYSVSFTPKGGKAMIATFSDQNRAKSYVRRNLVSMGAYAG